MYRRIFVLKFFLKKLFLKFFIKSALLHPIHRLYSLFKKSFIIKFATKNTFSNRCIISGRNHTTVTKFRYSRFFFRSWSYQSKLMNITRFSR